LTCAGRIWEELNYKHRYSLPQSITSLSLGENHLCYIQNEEVFCSGSAQFGATTFRENIIDKFEKVHHSDSKKFKARFVSAGASHTCGVFYELKNKKDSIFCWGNNSISQLALDNRASPHIIPVPKRVEILDKLIIKNVKSLKSGHAHNCLLVEKGLFCWGSNLKEEISSFKPKVELPYFIRQVPFAMVENFSLGVHSTCILAHKKIHCQGVQGNAPLAQ
jgi:alpha-tubulin suppressor-like RCC1 family protein